VREGEGEKSWEVGGIWETHRLIRQNDLAGGDAVNGSPSTGAAPNKLFNVAGLYGQWDITQYDRVKLRGYVFERFVADQGESGFRFDDMILQYTRRIPFPEDFTLRVTPWVLIPLSFDSRLQSLYTAPRLTFELEKKFGRYVIADLRTRGDAFFYKYRTSGPIQSNPNGTPQAGGTPNPKYDVGFSAEVEVAMPFHEALSFGADVATAYTWYYQPVNVNNDTNVSVQQNGAVADPTYSSQPIQQTYYGEVFVRYTMPSLVGMKSDLVVAFANGDPSIGSVSVLHDGVGHVYLGYRQNAEVYAAFTLRY
jgi:hypothetical protein